MRSRLDLSLFMSNAMYIAVFERQVNKCSPVATTSQPSTLRVAPRLSRAVTKSVCYAGYIVTCLLAGCCIVC